MREINGLMSNEVDSLLRMLLDKSLKESIKDAIRKHLTVTIFAALDYFFRNSVRVLIDKYNLNTDALFPVKSRPRLNKIIQDNNTTKGTIVASTYRFVDTTLTLFHFISCVRYGRTSFFAHAITKN